jgi:hypothetical protein
MLNAHTNVPTAFVAQRRSSACFHHTPHLVEIDGEVVLSVAVQVEIKIKS